MSTDDVAGIFKRWGDHIAAERDARALTQEQVATLAGVNISTVSRVEAGTAGFAAYVAVARVLGLDVSLDWART